MKTSVSLFLLGLLVSFSPSPSHATAVGTDPTAAPGGCGAVDADHQGVKTLENATAECTREGKSGADLQACIEQRTGRVRAD